MARIVFVALFVADGALSNEVCDSGNQLLQKAAHVSTVDKNGDKVQRVTTNNTRTEPEAAIKYWAMPGCPAKTATYGGSIEQLSRLEAVTSPNEEDEYGVHCCEDDENVKKQNGIPVVSNVFCISKVVPVVNWAIATASQKKPQCVKKNLKMARHFCKEAGRRLCTVAEIKTNICCTNDCQEFDEQLVWADTSEISITPPPSATPAPDGLLDCASLPEDVRESSSYCSKPRPAPRPRPRPPPVAVSYIPGPKVSNGASKVCSSWYGTLENAISHCSKSASCSVLHDYACDGKNWRYCDKTIGQVENAGWTDTDACTKLKTRVVPYNNGPKVSNSAATVCSKWYGRLEEAKARCTASEFCNVLHDYGCDGENWRYCDRTISEVEQAGTDTKACTRLKDDPHASQPGDKAFDCNKLPRSMQGSTYQNGCPGAVWYGGEPSESYCTSSDRKYAWWKACCMWDKKGKVCKPKTSLGGYDCAVLPTGPNGVKGCSGAAWKTGVRSKEICQAKWPQYEWWKACCSWNVWKCVAKKR